MGVRVIDLSNFISVNKWCEPTELLVTILVSALTAISAIVAEKFLSRLWDKISLKVRELRWRKLVPKLFRNRDIMLQLEKGSEVSVLGDVYKVMGLTMIVAGGVKIFEFLIKKGSVDRWLEFNEDGSILWANWTDREIWNKIGIGKKEMWPEAVPKVAVVDSTLTSLEIGGIQTTLEEAKPSAQIETLWGEWESGYPIYKKMNYSFAVALINQKQPPEEKRPTYITLEAYGQDAFFNRFFVGLVVKDSEIDLI